VALLGGQVVVIGEAEAACNAAQQVGLFHRQHLVGGGQIHQHVEHLEARGPLELLVEHACVGLERLVSQLAEALAQQRGHRIDGARAQALDAPQRLAHVRLFVGGVGAVGMGHGGQEARQGTHGRGGRRVGAGHGARHERAELVTGRGLGGFGRGAQEPSKEHAVERSRAFARLPRMYSGITRGLFPVVALEPREGVTRLTVLLSSELAAGVGLGASIAIDGVCLTVVGFEGSQVSFETIAETMALTTLGALHLGRLVSVERSVKVGDELGGHDVFGHVVGTGEVLARAHVGEQLDLTIGVPAAWMKYILHKGFVALDGSSLTVGAVRPEGSFDVHLIPETLRLTNFANRQVGDRVNVELDPRTVAIVDTVERVLAARGI
jgi:riboflavin synthase